jgi:hypothetical protein
MFKRHFFIGHLRNPEVGVDFPERTAADALQEIEVLLDSASKTMDFLLKFERGIR